MSMSKSDFLTLIVALSAYLAAVRLAVIGRLGGKDRPPNPTSYKRFLVFLIPADAPLVLSGLLLTTDLFLKDLFDVAPPTCLYTSAAWLFVFAVCCLAVHHVAAWIISVQKLMEACCERKTSGQD